jgi:integrase/recombinase XerD
MTAEGVWSREAALAAFDRYLRRSRGLCAGTRANYGRFAGAFLEATFPDDRVDVRRIRAGQVIEFVAGATDYYRPKTVELVATSLRSFFRFLRVEGLRADRLDDAVPMVPHRRSGLVRHLDNETLERLVVSLGSSSGRDLRDRAIILCNCRLGLRASEVARLRLEDIDWRAAVVMVPARKTGHGAVLPLTAEVGKALADYLQHGRPDTTAREVFVLHRLRPGAPISDSIVGRAVGRALDRAGIEAPSRGANLLRHSLATGLLARGAGLSQIADLLGHSCLATTRIYAASISRPCARSLCPGRRRDRDRAGHEDRGGLHSDAAGPRLSVGHPRALSARFRPAPRQSRPQRPDLALDWATSSTSTDPCNPARRLATVRGFLRQLSALDGATEVPAPGLLGPTGHRKPPHVYTDEELADLLHAAAALGPIGGLRPLCYVTLFGLLACTGLRISEALAISCADVDLDAGVITVRAGKRGLTRLVPLHPSALMPLNEYAAQRARMLGQPSSSDAFFRTEASEQISCNTARHAFRLLRRRLGWDATGRTRAPRVHDLRHRMVVRRIQAWHAEGVDVDAAIPALATYLGHVEVRDVYWYLSAVPELMGIVAERFEAFSRHQGTARS